MPSPCAALTSAPCLISRRTAAVSPRISASATDASTDVRGAAAAESSADAQNTAAARTTRLHPKREGISAVSELFHVVHAEGVHDAEHGIGHRRSVRGL